MQQLPNNCRIGKISVFPKNWKTIRADVKSMWYIKYRFYDDNLKQSRQILIKGGVNEFRTLKEKQDAIKSIIDFELRELELRLNKITNTYFIDENVNDVSEKTPVCAALNFAYEKIDVVNTTKIDMRSCLKFFSQSAEQLKFSNIPLKEVSKKHVRLIIDNIPNLDVVIQKRNKKTGELENIIRKKVWSNNQYNHTRAYIGMLFSELEEFDVISHNPALALSKKPITQQVKAILTHEERRKISNYLKEKNYRFYLFINIFFHSGARLTEFERLKIKDINLNDLSAKFLIKKGNRYIETLRPIKRIALNYWLEYLANFDEKEAYFLGKDLLPSMTKISKKQLTLRWKRWIKDHLGIEKDLYSLKHLNLDETAAALSIEDAAAMAGHTTPIITLKHYAVGEKERQNEKLRKVANPFS